MKREVLMKQMMPATIEVAEQILDIENEVQDQRILGRWKIGQLFDRCVAERRKHADTWEDQLAEFTDLSKATLYRARKLYITWPDRSKIERLADLTDSRGRAITEDHLVQLTYIADEKERQRYLDICLEEGWAAKRLEDEVRQFLDKTSRRQTSHNPSGRPFLPPASPYAGLKRLEKLVCSVGKYEQVMAEHVEPALLNPRSSEEVSPHLIGQIETSLERCQKVQELLSRWTDALRRARNRFMGAAVDSENTVSDVEAVDEFEEAEAHAIEDEVVDEEVVEEFEDEGEAELADTYDDDEEDEEVDLDDEDVDPDEDDEATPSMRRRRVR